MHRSDWFTFGYRMDTRVYRSLHQLLGLEENRVRVETLEGDLLAQSTASLPVGSPGPVSVWS